MLNSIKRIFNRRPRERAFQGAMPSRYFEDWTHTVTKINRDLRSSYNSLTLRARDLAKNNEFVVGFLRSLDRNVIGAHGFTFQSRAADLALRMRIEGMWKDYCSRTGGYVTLDEHCSARDFDILVMRSLIIDGEVFIRRVWDDASEYGYRYEVLDALDIDPYYNVTTMTDGHSVVMGIEFDERGREVAYYHRKQSGMAEDVYFAGEREKLPASEVYHIFTKTFPNQARGYTALAAIILNLAQLDAYRDAELVHARIQACTMGIWESNGMSGDVLDEQTENGETVREMRPGIFAYAPRGYTAKYLQNSSPNNQFGIFCKNVLRSIANALGVSYNKSTGDYESVNYSSLREATLEDRANFEEMQQTLITCWKDFQFRDFVESLLIRRKISPGEAGEAARHAFFGRRYPWVDPSKEIAAKAKELDLLLTDPITELEARGIDPAEHLDRWKQWNAMTADRGISFNIKPPLEMGEITNE